MIDESVLEELLAGFADDIPVPVNGPEQVLDALAVASKPSRPSQSQFPKLLLVAAAVVMIGLVGVAMLHSGSSTSLASKPSALAPSSERKTRSLDGAGSGSGGGTTNGFSKSSTATAPGGPTDGAKIVKTGTLDLQVAHGALRVSVNRVSAAAVGLAGYVSDSKTNYGGSEPTAQITIRVPVGNFETAIAHLDAIPGVKVVGESESGSDVTGQYTDLQAQLTAATSERDALLEVLSHAQSIGDILAVHDRVSAVQTDINQLQGRINVLNNQATLSSLAVTLSEKPTKAANAAHRSAPQHGLAKSWSDARQGFSDGIEWLIARSGGALIVLLAALALLFGVRYLYPIVRRGLV